MNIIKFIITSLFVLSFSLNAKESSIVKHVIFIGIDGLGSHNLRHPSLKGQTPHIDLLKSRSLWSENAQIDERNFSGPNWGAMQTGSSSEVHGIKTNNCENGNKIPTIFDQIKENNNSLKTAIVYEWKPVTCYAIRDDAFDKKRRSIISSSRVGKNAARLIRWHRPNFLFIDFDKVDFAGHRHNGNSKQYVKAVKRIDKEVGRILRAVQKAGIENDTAIILSADHGHDFTGGRHSSNKHPVPLYINLPGSKGLNIDKFSYTVRNAHVAPIVAHLLGIPSSIEWEYNWEFELYKHLLN